MGLVLLEDASIILLSKSMRWREVRAPDIEGKWAGSHIDRHRFLYRYEIV